jgi:hypothetical protein
MLIGEFRNQMDLASDESRSGSESARLGTDPGGKRYMAATHEAVQNQDPMEIRAGLKARESRL